MTRDDPGIRTMPGTTGRNGRPEGGGYTWRGHVEDPADIVARTHAEVDARVAALRETITAARIAGDLPVDYWPAHYPGRPVPAEDALQPAPGCDGVHHNFVKVNGVWTCSCGATR